MIMSACLVRIMPWTYSITSSQSKGICNVSGEYHRQFYAIIHPWKKGCYNPIWCHKTDMDRIFVLPIGWNWHEMYLWLSSNNIWPHLGRNFTSMPSESPAERWCCNMWANTHQSPRYVPCFENNLKGECFYYIVMVVIIQKFSIFKGGSAKSPYKLEYVWVAVSFKVDLAI